MVDAFSVLEWKKSEVIFVGVILAVIAVISGVQLRTAEMKSRDVQRKADVEVVGRALSAYLDDHKILPAAEQGRVEACGFARSEACEWGQDAIEDIDGVLYLKKLPGEPFADRGWKYIYSTNAERTKYKICISLEYKADKEFKNVIQCNWYVKN